MLPDGPPIVGAERGARHLAQPRPRVERMGAFLRIGACARRCARRPTVPASTPKASASSVCAESAWTEAACNASTHCAQRGRCSDAQTSRAIEQRAPGRRAAACADAAGRRRRRAAGARAGAACVAHLGRRRAGQQRRRRARGGRPPVRAGKAAVVTLQGDPARLPADAAQALARARAAGVPISGELPRALDAQDLAIDALLGLGASRAPDGALARADRRTQRRALPGARRRPAVRTASGHRPGPGRARRARVAHACRCSR